MDADAWVSAGERHGSRSYGSPGWSMALRIWPVIAPFTPSGRVPWFGPEADLVTSRLVRDGAGGAHIAPVEDVVAFDLLDGVAASMLLERLPPCQLDDRQGAGPSLGRLLRAAADHPREVRLSGYGISPHRSAERVTVASVAVIGREWTQGAELPLDTCQVLSLWSDVRSRFDLDCLGRPTAYCPIEDDGTGELIGWELFWG